MAERRTAYVVHNPLQSCHNAAIMYTEYDAIRTELEELERRLIPLLVTVQRALGKEPSVLTRAERRRG